MIFRIIFAFDSSIHITQRIHELSTLLSARDDDVKSLLSALEKTKAELDTSVSRVHHMLRNTELFLGFA